MSMILYDMAHAIHHKVNCQMMTHTHTERYKSILNGRQYTNLCAQTAGLCDDLTFAIAYRIYSIQIMFQISASSLKT